MTDTEVVTRVDEDGTQVPVSSRTVRHETRPDLALIARLLDESRIGGPADWC